MLRIAANLEALLPLQNKSCWRMEKMDCQICKDSCHFFFDRCGPLVK